MPAIHIQNENKSIEVLSGTNFRKAALQSGIRLYKPFQRVFHVNFNFGPVKFPCGSDVVEVVEGKGVNARTDQEAAAIAGRLLLKRKVAPNYRLACMLNVTGDVTLRTMPERELDKEATRAHLGFLAVVGAFLLLMLIIIGVIGLDLVKKF